MISDPDPDSRAYAPRTAALPDIPAAIGRGMVRYAQVDESTLAGRTVKAPLEGVIARGRGLAAIGKGLEDLGEAGAKLHQEVQRAKAITAEADAENLWEKFQNEADLAITKSADPGDWEKIAAGAAEKFQSAMTGKKMPEFARRIIAHKSAGWIERYVGGTRINAARQQIHLARTAMQSRYEAHLEAGNFAGAAQVNREMTAVGYQMKDTEDLKNVQAGKEFKRQVEAGQKAAREAEFTRLRTVTYSKSPGAGPFVARDALEAGHFAFTDPGDLRDARAEVEEAVRKARRDGVYGEGGLRDQIVTNDANDQDIKNGVAALRLGPEVEAELLDFRSKLGEAKAAKAPLDHEALAQLHTDISGYAGDETSDPGAMQWGTLTRRAAELTAGGGREGEMTRSVLMQSLYARHPFQERRMPDADLMLDALSQKLTASVDSLAADEGFGPLERSVPDMKPDASGKLVPEGYKLVPNPDARRKQRYVQANLWLALQRDYRAHPDKWADPDYLDEWLWGKEGKGGRLQSFRTAATVEKMRQGAGPPEASLFPQRPAREPSVEDLEKLIK